MKVPFLDIIAFCLAGFFCCLNIVLLLIDMWIPVEGQSLLQPARYCLFAGAFFFIVWLVLLFMRDEKQAD